MCRADPNTAHRQPPRLLLSLDSFSSKEGVPPSLSSCFFSGILILAFLTSVELVLRQVFASMKDLHPVLENETNRQILARHIGVDALSCFIVSILGWYSRHICFEAVMKSAFRRSSSMPLAGYEQRLYSYHAGAFRIAFFFFMYQVKNLYDSVMWEDGAEYIFHHCFSLATAWGSLYSAGSGVGHFYCIFFFGLSEVSTAVLTILANFNDDFGVPGLGDAMPMTKVVIGGLFVCFFILCRCILWPIFSRHFVADVLMALKGDDPRTKPRRAWLKFFMISLTGLSILQVAWLGQIFMIGKEELIKVGLL